MIGAPSGIGRYGNGDERRATSASRSTPTVDVPKEEIVRAVRASLDALDPSADTRTLNLRNYGVDDALITAVVEELTDPGNSLAQMITRLDLRGNQIGDRGAAALAQLPAALPALTEILLSRNNVGDEGCAALASGLVSNDTLRTLNLNDNSVGDGGCAALGEMLKANTGLTKLLLENNAITDAGVTSLAVVLQPSDGADAAAGAAGGEGGPASEGGPSSRNTSLEQLPLGRNTKIVDTVSGIVLHHNPHAFSAIFRNTAECARAAGGGGACCQRPCATRRAVLVSCGCNSVSGSGNVVLGTCDEHALPWR